MGKSNVFFHWLVSGLDAEIGTSENFSSDFSLFSQLFHFFHRTFIFHQFLVIGQATLAANLTTASRPMNGIPRILMIFELLPTFLASGTGTEVRTLTRHRL